MLHLWDCGGQEAFMENYLASQKDQIFKNVQVSPFILSLLFPVSRQMCGKNKHFNKIFVNCDVVVGRSGV